MFESLIEPPDGVASLDGSTSRKARPIVAVIGAGASGTLTALHLAAAPDAPEIRLFERGPDAGRGLAYGAAAPDHLLNVRASAMSAFQDRPDHFVAWLGQVGAPYRPDDFIPRPVYGAYLGDLLRQAMDQAGERSLIIDHDEVVAARPTPPGWRLTTGDGRRLAVDALVLASGLAPPTGPARLDPALAASSRYVADPWDGRTRLAELGQRVLLLGTGLTMVDLALSLAEGGRRVSAISRRGRLPEAHAAGPLTPIAAPAHAPPAALLRELRRASRGHDWRAAVDGLRPATQAIWAAWSPAQRESFLRHGRCWWDAHRHRMAPAAAQRIAELRQRGFLTVRAGRVLDLVDRPDGVEVAWIERGGDEIARQRFDAVVNCMGRSADLRRPRDRLSRQLLAAGLVRPDASGFGVEVDDRSRPIGAAGAPAPGLYAVGALAQGRFWEITAIPDIRVQASRIARSILDIAPAG